MASRKQQDPETGVSASARDGEPMTEGQRADLDELAARRAELSNGEQRGQPIDDQPEEDPAAELFPLGSLEGDPKVTHRTLIKAGTPVKLECALTRAAVPMTGGLHAYGDVGEVLVTFEAGKVTQVPEFASDRGADGRRKLRAVKLVQELTAVHVRSGAGLYSLEQVLDILEQAFGIPRSADKVAEVFGPVTAEQRAAAAG